jgi:hypothetical protein
MKQQLTKLKSQCSTASSGEPPFEVILVATVGDALFVKTFEHVTVLCTTELSIKAAAPVAAAVSINCGPLLDEGETNAVPENIPCWFALACGLLDNG